MITLSANDINAQLFLNGTELVHFVARAGDCHGSRIGKTYEILNATLALNAHEIVYRPGMARRLGMIEILQFWSGYFDERHIEWAVPKLQYPYGIENAYGIKVAQQLPKVIQQLKDNPNSRRAIIHIGKAEDGAEVVKPCMQSLQFQIRNGQLHMTVFARSWDAISGLPYDIMLFSGINQIMSKLLKVSPGTNTINASSLHVYDDAYERLKKKIAKWDGIDPWNTMEVGAVLYEFDDARNWSIDQLNSKENWSFGMPEGVDCYAR